MVAFDALVRELLDELLALEPVEATRLGVHEHDGRWPDWSTAGTQARLATARAWRERVAALPDGDLHEDERIDRDRLILELDHRQAAARFAADAWDPMTWVYRIGGALLPLITREFAPLDLRLASFAARLEGLPAVIDAAVERLGAEDAGVPVSRLHTDVALRNLPGLRELVSEAQELAEAGGSDPAVAGVRPRLDAAAVVARGALERLHDHLHHAILPGAEGEGRLGPERFEERLRLVFSDPTMTADRILAAAEAQYPQVRAEMARLAKILWPTWCPGVEAPERDDDVVRATIDAVARDHPAGAELLDACRSELARIEEFCREHDVVGLTDEPLEIQWTPRFLRSSAGAMLDSPGPFDRGQKAFFSVTPPAEDWDAERVESMLREHNRRQVTLLTIHEAVPGHYLQGVYGNRAASIVRSAFGDGVYAEGWAVYVTQVMLDLGFDADDPALRLMHWKFYLRSIVNAIIDVRIHTRGMTRDAALSLMVDGAWQERSEALGKWDRARLSSGQLSTYFVGSLAMWDLEVDARRRAAIAAGDARGPAAVPEQRIVGGIGSTPGFDQRAHLEAVLGCGELPIPLLRRALLGA